MDKRVLVVTSDRVAAESLAKELPAVGFECEVAANAELALRSLEKDPEAIVVASQLLPGLDGALFVRRVKERPVPSPVVVLGVVSSTAALRDVATACGADAVLPRNWTTQTLTAELRRLSGSPAPSLPTGIRESPVAPAPPRAAALDPAWLLGRAFSESVTGALTFSAAVGAKTTVWLSRGRPLHVVRGDHTTEEEVSPEACASVLVDLFGWTEAQVTFTPGELPDDLLAVAIERDAVLVEGLRRYYGEARLLAGLLDEERVLTPAAPAERLDRLRLHPSERAALAVMNGHHTIAEATAHGGDRMAALRAVYACLCLGILVDAEADVAEEEPEPAEPEARLQWLIERGERALLEDDAATAFDAFRRVLELDPGHRLAALAVAQLRAGAANS